MPTKTRQNANYRDISGPTGRLAKLEEFEGNTMSGRIEGERYVVRSYAATIATFNLTTGIEWHSTDRWSVTTSKHQGYTRAWLGASEEMKRKYALELPTLLTVVRPIFA